MPSKGKSNMSFDDEYNPPRGHRGIPRKSPFHFVGQLTYLNAAGKSQAVGFGSLLEYHTALCCIYRPDFLDIEEQLAPIRVRHGGVRATPYWFDFRLTLTSGKRIALAVKPEAKADRYVFREKMRAVTRVAVPSIADAVCVITERNIDPFQLANAKLFHAGRHPEEVMDAQVEAELLRLEQPVAIRDFLARCGIGSAGFWSVVRAIRTGIVQVAAGECITASSIISAQGGV